MHIAKNVKVIELSLYEDAILDAYYHNIPADDELWYRIVEVLVLLLTCTQKKLSSNYRPFSLPTESGNFQVISLVCRLVGELALIYKVSAT
jgi:hypothetical protein